MPSRRGCSRHRSRQHNARGQKIYLELDRRLRLLGDRLLTYAVLTRDLAQRMPAVRGEKGLELELVLAIRRRVELGFQVRAERGVPEPLRDDLRECLGPLRQGGE